MAGQPASATFETTVTATGNNTGIAVPEEVIERLGAGKRPALLVNLNGYEYRTTAGVMGGKHMVTASAPPSGRSPGSEAATRCGSR